MILFKTRKDGVCFRVSILVSKSIVTPDFSDNSSIESPFSNRDKIIAAIISFSASL